MRRERQWDTGRHTAHSRVHATLARAHTELTLNKEVPATLLVLSRAYTLPSAAAAAVAPASTPEIEKALQATINALPEEVVKEVELDMTEIGGADAKEKRVRARADF